MALGQSEAFAEGAGVALLPVAMFARQIAEGRLVQPFGTMVSAGRYYLTWHSDRPQTNAMARFRQWIITESSRAT